MRSAEALVRTKFHDYRRYSSSAHRDFTLLIEEFRNLILQPCAYCGSMPRKTVRKGYHPANLNGVDRIDNSLGYTTQNCVTACQICNFIKGSRARDEFLAHAKQIYAKNFNSSR